jgi:Mg-chelatase subunit ChlD
MKKPLTTLRFVHYLIILVVFPFLSFGQCPEGTINQNKNLIVNGDFENFNQGFTSDYLVSTNLGYGHYGIYSIVRDASAWFKYFKGTGENNFMAVDGADVPGLVVWRQIVPVKPKTTYLFSAWLSNLYEISKGPTAVVQFYINGELINRPFRCSENQNTWEQFMGSWNSNSANDAVITIISQNTEGIGNDFGLDKIRMFECNKVIADTQPVKKVTDHKPLQVVKDSFICKCPEGTFIQKKNLIINGDFENFYKGFTSDYQASPNSGFGKYFIVKDASNWYSGFKGIGENNFMAVDGADVPGLVVWKQIVLVKPNTTYLFSAWLSNLYDILKGKPAVLAFFINGEWINPSFRCSDNQNTWEQFKGSWDSNFNDEAIIMIFSQNTEGRGNDFGMDNIQMFECNKVIIDPQPVQKVMDHKPVQVVTDSFICNGSATPVPQSDCFHLTSAVNSQQGAVWFTKQIDLTKAFDIEFYLNFGSIDEGADGIAFVLQTQGTNALGDMGGHMGLYGISPSFGIEFDDYQNPEQNDPPYDHIAIIKNGLTSHPARSSVFNPVPAGKHEINIENGRDHLVRIKWNPDGFLLEVFFDCESRIKVSDIDLMNYYFNNNPMVWWGFTASTGGSVNDQTVCIKKSETRNYTFQTCENAPLTLNTQQSADNTYHWIPNLWLSDNQIKNPVCKPSETIQYFVTYKNLCGEKVMDSIKVLVDPLPKVILPQDTFFTGENAILIKPVIKNNVTSWRWSNNHSSINQSLSYTGWHWFEATNACGSFRDSIFIGEKEKKSKVPANDTVSIKHDTLAAPPISKTAVTSPPPIDDIPEFNYSNYKLNNLIFVIDISTSMNYENRLNNMKTTLENLTMLLRAEDKIHIITYSDEVKVLLENVSGNQKDSILKTIHGLKASGLSNGSSAIKKAYKLGKKNYIRGGNNQIFIATDGLFSQEKKEEKKTVNFVHRKESRTNIHLSCLAFGKNKRGIQFLRELSATGEGSFHLFTNKSEEKYVLENLIRLQSKK